MLEPASDGTLIRITIKPCSESQFYTVYWKEAYGVDMPNRNVVTPETLAKFVESQVFSL